MDAPSISKAERLQIIASERGRLAHGLYAAEVDVIVSKASPGDGQRLADAEARLADVQTRIAVCEQLAEQVEAEPDAQPA